MTAVSPNRRKRRADVSTEDLELWRRLTRDIAPLPRRARADRVRTDRRPITPADLPGGASEASPAAAPQPRRAPALPQPNPTPASDPFAGIDRASAERLKRGKRAIDARLDLHGMTQSQAHRALSGFVATSRAAGHRCVLVITGRGQLGGGILKQAVPRWLAEPELRAHVLALAPAQPQHGGSGALYLLLRRIRAQDS
jgi:DNA-nicking Smr family endonuclease